MSVLGFALRWYWMLTDNPRLASSPAKRLPHVIDTVLLGSAIGMLVLWQVWPWQMDWLLAKIIALLVYIGLGMVALRFGGSRAQRGIAGALALATAAYIITVAFTKSPLG
ncbi:MAG: SirB2 family protein [Halioglobus sp.]|nr:SirB2 family protein [Halioglobus sp.]